MSPALTACIHQSWKWSRKRRLRLYDFWLQGGGAFYSVSKPLLMKRGTGGSNPLPSSGESGANSDLPGFAGRADSSMWAEGGRRSRGCVGERWGLDRTRVEADLRGMNNTWSG
jgi:hypothetical protein